jgi:hypothetical protein
MPNAIFTDKVAAKIVRGVKNKINVASTMTKKFEMEFEDKAEPIGQILRIKKPVRGRVVDGTNWVGGATDRIYVSSEAAQPFHVEYQSDVLETMFEMERTQSAKDENIYNPLIDDLVQQIDTRAAQFAALRTSMHVGAIGVTPTSFDTWGQLMSRIDEKDGFNGQRRAGMFMTPEAHRTMVSGTPNALALFHNGGQNANAVFRDSEIPRYSGYDIRQSMSLYAHTTGILANGTVQGLTVSVTSVSGDTSIIVAGTNGDTFQAGDYLTVGSTAAGTNRYDVNPRTRNSLFRRRQLTIAGAPGQTYTIAGGVVTLPLVEPIYGPDSIYQNIASLPQAADTVTLDEGTTLANGVASSGYFGMAYTNDAFGIMGHRFPAVKQSAFDLVSEFQDPDTGIMISIIGWTVPETRQKRWRADTCISFVNLMGDTSSALIGMLN